MVVIVAVGLARIIWGIDLQLMTADAGAVEASPVAGIMSNIGILVWAAGAGIPLFTSFYSHGWQARLLRAGGLMTLLLAIDDTLMLHDEALPALGIPESVVLAVLGLLTAGFLVWYRRHVLAGPKVFMMLAVAGFTLMLVLDTLEPLGLLKGHAVIEEGFKLIAIVNWTGYFVMLAARTLAGRLTEERRDMQTQ
ncbi:hypothetical protein DV701_09775 [Ornithinimicrobium avium]|uniref:Oxidase n=2 Tax=Ornithinimicrobium avium TaxID=2283195 RepID=A0A345NMW0_9MICO|nr:hypothetical protein DV701_09775 [Ornithinimicrobium avium]